ncbi:RmlC-like cupin domain-containing protein [Stachybotrys elegans]|uniref:RmlC-like cupin domain-containing protein n=1 Tax=Stachybotrys elegans TaxID=80388 RepID=A0A8K0SQH5_9HYPO|nr:RmlC-like cupin domain-containing protein [Stachybotrys elegans]
MSSKPTITPLTSLSVSRHLIPATSKAPNTSIQQKPLLIYHSVFSSTYTTAIERHLRDTAVVVPQWRYTMYDMSHYHSTTHEVLCVSHGRARLCFGGEDNPERVESVVCTGDVIIVPAGVAHCLLEDIDGAFEMVGSYPPGKAWDMCYGRPGEEGAYENIAALAWFDKDPIYGDSGPVLDHVTD